MGGDGRRGEQSARLAGRTATWSYSSTSFDSSELTTEVSELARAFGDRPTAAAFADALAPVLLSDPALATLARLQSALDPIDIEGLDARLRSTGSKDLCSMQPADLSHEISLEEYELIVRRLEAGRPIDGSDDLRTLKAAYLLSAAFKDCSVFVRLYQDGSHDVHFVDVDAKPLARLPHYAQLDARIWRNASTLPLSAPCRSR